MHLVAETAQSVHLSALGEVVEIPAGESIWTESCYKFTRASTEAMLQGVGMELERWYTDGVGSYALALAAPG